MLRFIFLNRIRPLRKNIINYFLSFKKLSSFFLIVLFTLFQIIYFTLSVYQNSNIQLNPAKPTQSDLTCLKKSNIWTNAGYSFVNPTPSSWVSSCTSKTQVNPTPSKKKRNISFCIERPLPLLHSTRQYKHREKQGSSRRDCLDNGYKPKVF